MNILKKIRLNIEAIWKYEDAESFRLTFRHYTVGDKIEIEQPEYDYGMSYMEECTIAGFTLGAPGGSWVRVILKRPNGLFTSRYMP